MRRLLSLLETLIAVTRLPEIMVGSIAVYAQEPQQELVAEALSLVRQFDPAEHSMIEQSIRMIVATHSDSRVNSPAHLSYINFEGWSDPLLVGLLLLFHSEWVRLGGEARGTQRPRQAVRIRASFIQPRRFVEWFCEHHELSDKDTSEALGSIDALATELAERALQRGLYERFLNLFRALRND
jgi:hypothetical protein